MCLADFVYISGYEVTIIHVNGVYEAYVQDDMSLHSCGHTLEEALKIIEREIDRRSRETV